jgi:hypothetical protein
LFDFGAASRGPEGLGRTQGMRRELQGGRERHYFLSKKNKKLILERKGADIKSKCNRREWGKVSHECRSTSRDVCTFLRTKWE